VAINARVVVMEDDLYARNFMMMLLMRDWRTTVVADVSNEKELLDVLNNPVEKIDVILLDTEAPHHMDWLINATKLVKSSRHNCFILCTGTKPHSTTLKNILTLQCHGYVIKDEISYGLAAAVQYVAMGRWVITPSVKSIAAEYRIELPHEKMVIINHVGLDFLTQREKQILELSILFNLSQRDVSDETGISRNQVGKYVRRAYVKMGLDDFLVRENLPEGIFESILVLHRFKKAQIHHLNKQRVPNKATLAFHLLTFIEEVT